MLNKYKLLNMSSSENKDIIDINIIIIIIIITIISIIIFIIIIIINVAKTKVLISCKVTSSHMQKQDFS